MKAGMQDKDVMQTAYHIQASFKEQDLLKGKKLVWDTKKTNSDQSIHIIYQGPQLNSGQRIYWRVKIWDNQGRESTWSAPAFWENGLLKASDWDAEWITPDIDEDPEKDNPPTLLRKSFEVNKNIQSARLYITSHGLYEAYLNGQKIGDEVFTPGWTSYNKRIQYQTFDVTHLLEKGANAMGVHLGDGWFRGRFGFSRQRNIYGEKLALLCQLEITYKNGKVVKIISDNTWKSSTGPIQWSGIYDGALYDARKEKPGWNTTQYQDTDWRGVNIANHPKSRLIAPAGVPIRKIEEIKPVRIFSTPNGEKVVDLGQNMVGWVKLSVRGKAGDAISLYHAEVLDKDGNFYLDNLRSAKQKIEYICKGNGEEVYEPTFTFQGFRYVMVENYPGELTKDAITGIVIHSDMEPSGTFECDYPLINQLQSNIQWGQKGNFLDVPTDCPQRDERMGWTGDAQAFAPTACFNFNTAAFYTKWLGDVIADQREDGAVPFVVPHVLADNSYGSTGWADAATIIPWTMYRKYGDQKILEVQYESMKNWVNYLNDLAGENRLVQDGFHFGDWLFFIHPTSWNDKPGYTDIDFLATAFFAYSTDILVKTSKVLGHSEDTKKYAGLFNEIKAAFQKEFVTPGGRLSPHSQTAYTLALAFDLLTPNQINTAVNYLTTNIEKRQFHLSTGFLGTPHLCHVLSKYGKTDVAFKLLLQDTYPSWLYPVTRGATTIWERWDGIKPDSSFQTPRMNSFNHYAYGAIGDWMYSVVSGIQDVESHPGYKQLVIKPHPSQELGYARAEHQSLYGKIVSGWKYADDMVTYDIEIPPNTMATVMLPGENIDLDNRTEYTLGSGKHQFTVANARKTGATSGFSISTNFEELWKNERTKAILVKHVPGIEQAPQDQLQQGFPYSLEVIAEYAPEVFTAEIMKKIDADLKALK
jgi:alpha-L-rhamnosidase